jgi:HEAT repeat protein
MPLQPSQYPATPVEQLLVQAGLGRVGLDQRWIAALTARPTEAVPALVAYGLNPPEDSRLQLDSDILNLLAAMPVGDPMDYVVSLLRDGFSEIPESMHAIARRAGAKAVDSLITLYRELEEEASSEVAFLLAGLGLRDERILAIILERLEFDMEDGAMLLGLYGDPAGIPALEKLSIELGKNRELDFALEQLRVGSGEIFESEIDHLSEYPDTASPEFEVLEDDEIVEFATQHEDESVRLAALDVLEDLELPQSAVIPLIQLASGEDSVPVRAAAFRALARLNQIEEVRALADATLENTSTPAAIRAASLITLLPESISATRLREHVENFLANPESRADAVHAMWRSREASYNTRFGALLEDPDLAVCRQAVRGAGVCGDVTAIGKLRDLMMDEDLRKDAIFAYAMAVPSDISASRVRSLYTRIEKEAGGLNRDEATSVGIALDMRLEAAGKDPVFFSSEEEEEAAQ